MSVDDFTSLLDQLLLVDTLLLGFVINLMTASALSKDDFVARDEWSLEQLSHATDGNNPPSSYPGIMSYEVVRSGSLAVSLLFSSLMTALVTYNMLNLSECRESERIFKYWSRSFLILMWASSACLIVGLYYFYDCYKSIVAMIFPLYCTDDPKPTLADLNPQVVQESRLFYNLSESSMIEVPARYFEGCKDVSYTYAYFEQTSDWTFRIFIFVLSSAVFLNIVVHCFSLQEDVDERMLEPELVGTRGSHPQPLSAWTLPLDAH